MLARIRGRMHPRNRYFHNRTDFGELAEFRPSLKPYLIEKQRPRPDLKPHPAAPPNGAPSVGNGTPDLAGGPPAAATGTPAPAPSTGPEVPTAGPDPAGAPPALPTGGPPAGTTVALPTSTAVAKGRNKKRGNKFSYTMDFSNPEALRELAYGLLEKDFDLQLTIPLDGLIPTVPQKLNYIHWVEDLLSCVGVASNIEGVASNEEGVVCERLIPKGKDTIGIDIGTGMSCIYPLLGSKLNNWSFVATDISMATVQCATENVSRNSLQEYIKVKLVSEDAMLKEVVDPETTHYAFSMCNPPFFKSEEEKLGGLSSHGDLRPLPSTFSTGTEKETTTEGGEVEFVKRMIEDSLTLRDRIRWYTSMLGKKSSVKQLSLELLSHQVPVVTTTEFIQGKTWRWGLAWSFDETLKDKVVMTKPPKKKKKPAQIHCSLQLVVIGKNGGVPCASTAGVQRVSKWLEEEWGDLEINSTVESYDASVESGDPIVTMRCVAERAMWTNQRKVRKLKARLKSCTSNTAQGMEGGLLTSESLLDIERRIVESELHSLCAPCNMEFVARVKLQTQQTLWSGSVNRKRKTSVGQGKGRKKRRVEMAKEGSNEVVMGEGEEGGEGRSKVGEEEGDGGGGGSEMAVGEEEGGKGDGGEGRSKVAVGEEGGRKGDEGKSEIAVSEEEEGRKTVGEGIEGLVEMAEGEQVEGESRVCVELDWIKGDQGRDLLHQLLQYLRNKMTLKDFI